MSRLGNILNKLVTRVVVESETISNSGGNTAKLYKTGDVVVAHVNNTSSKTIPKWSNVSFGTIPENMRPNQNVFIPIPRQEVTSYVPVYFYAQTTGEIGYINQGNSSYTTGNIMAMSAVWVVGGG